MARSKKDVEKKEKTNEWNKNTPDFLSYKIQFTTPEKQKVMISFFT